MDPIDLKRKIPWKSMGPMINCLVTIIPQNIFEELSLKDVILWGLIGMEGFIFI